MLDARLTRFLAVAVLACWSTQWAAAQSSANYAIPLSAFNAGVGDTASASYRLSSSLGDSFATGSSSSASFVLTHGLFGAGAVTGTPPLLAAAVSRKVHGAAGTFDLPLSLADVHNPTTEPRQGPAQTIVFTFDKAISAANAVIAEGAAVASAPIFSGTDVVVNLSGVANQQYVTVSLTGVSSTDGGAGGVASVRVGFLLGDVNQNRVISLADLALVNQQLAQTVTATNYLKDVNVSGTLSLADKAITNANLTRALPVP